ncbi:aquaporin AQPcic-like [Musca vetustissima]|uniref:aquaporin AQPcic-like n=1 Tax=Musca vetustissima TaxID=27455 RepID=UPI002AB71A2C|nr:aquaporin AQPcic-like [Musca vetustissima]
MTQQHSSNDYVGFMTLLNPKERKHLLDNLCSIVSEFIGTGMLMLFGCMGCMNSELFPSTNVTRSLNFGFVVLIIIQCFGCCSGAHLNPAVSVAAYIYELISLPMVAAYIVAQIVGAYCGYGLLTVLLPENQVFVPGSDTGLCMTSIHHDIDVWQALGIEVCITATLIIVCCGVWDPRNKCQQDSVAIRFGLAVACLSITAGPLTGASMNPARSLAPALWHNDFRNHWVYWMGPLIGAFIAAPIYKCVFRREIEEKCESTPTKMNEVQCS